MLGVGLLDLLEHEGMITDLPQLHDGVHQRLGASLSLLVSLRTVGQQHATVLHVTVQEALERRHLTLDHVLDLVKGK